MRVAKERRLRRKARLARKGWAYCAYCGGRFPPHALTQTFGCSYLCFRCEEKVDEELRK